MPSNRLQEILDSKKAEVDKIRPLAEKLHVAALERNDVRSLYDALRKEEGEPGLRLLAEVKKASPSAGVISPDFDPVAVARTYDAAGASAISVLTDEPYFQGKLEYLVRVRAQVGVPCLRKDFIIDEVQIWEAAVAGADAILLIVAALEQKELEHLLDVATACQMDALVEVHDAEEMERALDTEAQIIGINNRNLKTFEVDLATTEALSEEVPDGVVLISESGIKTVDDAAAIAGWGADALLVGETLMRSDDVPATIAELMAAGDPSLLGT